MQPTLQENTFIDLFQDGVWTPAFLTHPGTYYSYVLSPLQPNTYLVLNANIAVFRTYCRRDVLDNHSLLQVLKETAGETVETMLEMWGNEEGMGDEAFVQVFAGLLPAEMARLLADGNSVKSDQATVHYQALCRFYELLPTVSPETIARTWAPFWTCQQRYIKQIKGNLTRLLSLHMQTIGSVKCASCLVPSFELLRMWCEVDLLVDLKRFAYDWRALGQAAEAYLDYCVRTVRMSEAVRTLALVFRCYTVVGKAELGKLVERLEAISFFFQDFPQFSYEKAEILNYLLLISDRNMTIEDVSADQILDSATCDQLVQQFPLAAAKLVKLTTHKPQIPSQISTNLPNFPAFSSIQLEKLLDKLPEEEEFELCWAMKAKRVVTELKDRKVVRRVRRTQRMAMVWTASRTFLLKLPRSLIREIASQI